MHNRRFRMAWGSKNVKEGAATKSDAIENIIGPSCVIRGDLAAEGAFRIDGTIEGSVESRASVVVGESGVIRGGVRGTDVVIAGTVQGDVACSATWRSSPRAPSRATSKRRACASRRAASSVAPAAWADTTTCRARSRSRRT